MKILKKIFGHPHFKFMDVQILIRDEKVDVQKYY